MLPVLFTKTTPFLPQAGPGRNPSWARRLPVTPHQQCDSSVLFSWILLLSSDPPLSRLLQNFAVLVRCIACFDWSLALPGLVEAFAFTWRCENCSIEKNLAPVLLN